jgi:hypothetical protein
MGAVQATHSSAQQALALLADHPVVRPELAAARAAIDAVLWNRQIRARAQGVAQASVSDGARASAAIDGADLVLPDDSPMGRVLDAALAVTAHAGQCERQWATAPLQVLAGMQAQVSRALASVSEPGRPRLDDAADDPLNLGALPPAAQVPQRLALLGRLLTESDEVPALVLAAVVHGEIQALRPFTQGSGLIARATVRCTLVQRGVDPAMFTIPELGMSMLGRPVYVAALRAYAQGTTEGMSEYLIWFARAIALGATVVTARLDG